MFIFLSIGLCHTHLAALQSVGWGYNGLNTKRLNADTKTEENMLLLAGVSGVARDDQS